MENKQLVGNDYMMTTLLDTNVFEQMQRAAGLFSKSGMVPETFRDNMPACFVGLQLAAQLQVNPFMLFQKIYTVKGKIGIEAQVAIAIANHKKVFQGPIEHTFKGEGKTRSCTATAVLTASGKEVSITIDWKTVEAEGWHSKPGSKWMTMPDQMFRYRTSLWLIRTYAPETLMGLNSIDELQDIEVEVIAPKSRKTIDQAFQEMAQVETEETEPVVATEPPPPDPKPEKPVEKPKAEPRAEKKPEPKPEPQIDLDELLAKYNIGTGALAAYTVRALKKNKPREDWTPEDQKAVVNQIVKTKGG